MQKIKRIAVDGELVAMVDISIWAGSTFAIRVARNPNREILFHADRIEDEVAHCRVLEGEELLGRLRVAAA